jgi:hypothetical protein
MPLIDDLVVGDAAVGELERAPEKRPVPDADWPLAELPPGLRRR